MEEKEMLKIIDEKGVEKEVEILHYFTLESNGKDYMVYTENEEDDSGDIIVYTSEVIEHEDEIELKGIEDQDVLQEVTKILTEIVQN